MSAVDLRRHDPVQIGTHHPDGSRTFAPPGDVCSICSDPDAGRWVPVSFCPLAQAQAERHAHRSGVYTIGWLS
jgi:hypothetical protein